MGDLVFDEDNDPWLYSPYRNGLNMVQWTLLANPTPCQPHTALQCLHVQY
jgi:hypothetical protein